MGQRRRFSICGSARRSSVMKFAPIKIGRLKKSRPCLMILRSKLRRLCAANWEPKLIKLTKPGMGDGLMLWGGFDPTQRVHPSGKKLETSLPRFLQIKGECQG